MFKIYISIMLLMSLFMMSTHTPLLMGLFLFLQMLLTCLISRLMMSSSWISLTLFLMTISGLMIIFMYIISVCSNSKFQMINWKIVTQIIPTILILNHFNFNWFFIDNYQLKDMYNNEFSKIFFPLNIPISLFMFIYLLIILVILINMLNNNKGPMRKKY